MSKQLTAGDPAPDFNLQTNGGGHVALTDFAGKHLILYFYPKDDTPGCTKEAIAFTEHRKDYAKLGAEIVGVSKDTVAKHDKFIDKHSLSVTLGSDEEGKTCEAYGVWVEKNMYGRKYMGIQRATFLIGPDGHIKRIWPKVKVAGHAEDVLAELKA